MVGEAVVVVLELVGVAGRAAASCVVSRARGPDDGDDDDDDDGAMMVTPGATG